MQKSSVNLNTILLPTYELYVQHDKGYIPGVRKV